MLLLHNVQKVEGNYYFPPGDVKTELFVDSTLHTTCGWKGRADYHTLNLGGTTVKDVAWTYPNPKPGAAHLEGYWALYVPRGRRAHHPEVFTEPDTPAASATPATADAASK